MDNITITLDELEEMDFDCAVYLCLALERSESSKFIEDFFKRKFAHFRCTKLDNEMVKIKKFVECNM